MTMQQNKIKKLPAMMPKNLRRVKKMIKSKISRLTAGIKDHKSPRQKQIESCERSYLR